jgi:hypothetical protein
MTPKKKGRSKNFVEIDEILFSFALPHGVVIASYYWKDKLNKTCQTNHNCYNQRSN